jgi:hypothetical protein
MESLEVVKAPTHLYDPLLEYALTVSINIDLVAVYVDGAATRFWFLSM